MLAVQLRKKKGEEVTAHSSSKRSVLSQREKEEEEEEANILYVVFLILPAEVTPPSCRHPAPTQSSQTRFVSGGLRVVVVARVVFVALNGINSITTSYVAVHVHGGNKQPVVYSSVY